MSMPGAADEIRRLSDRLARDPGGAAAIPLAELLMEAGELAAAEQALRGALRRHPTHLPAYTGLARIATARRAWDDAIAAWEEVARVAGSPSPEGAHARQAQAYACFMGRRWAEADAFLNQAIAAGGDPAAIAAARARLRMELGDDAGRTLFDSLLEEGDRTALLVAPEGQLRAGRCEGSNGRDVAPEMTLELAGVGEEATRAAAHLALGRWQSVMVEASRGVMGMAPVDDGLVLVAIDAGTPLGRLRRLLDRAAERARAWRGVA